MKSERESRRCLKPIVYQMRYYPYDCSMSLGWPEGEVWSCRPFLWDIGRVRTEYHSRLCTCGAKCRIYAVCMILSPQMRVVEVRMPCLRRTVVGS
jgi:hypothetical protein